VSVQSIGYNSFSSGVQKISNKSLKVILDTVEENAFPGSQLYLYFRMHTVWEEAIDPSEFITDTAFIHRYQLPQEERTEALLLKYFSDPDHVNNIFRILTESWIEN
jgi:hypothetical protein